MRAGKKRESWATRGRFTCYRAALLLATVCAAGAANAQNYSPAPPVTVGAGQKALTLPLTFTASAGFQEMYTDNVNVTPTNTKYDFISNPYVSGTLIGTTGDFTSDIYSRLGYIHYFNNTGLNTWDISAGGHASYDLVRQFLSLKGEGAVTQGYGAAGYGTATGTPGGSDYLREYVYGVGPELTTTLGDFMDLTAAGRYSQVFFNQISSAVTTQLPQNTTLEQGIVNLDTGDRIAHYQLVTSGRYLRANGGYSLEAGVQSLFIRLTPTLRAIGRGGYERITDPSFGIMRGLIWSAGLEYAPNKDSMITVEGGRRYNHVTWNAVANVQLAGGFSINGTYREAVEPQQVWIYLSVADLYSPATVLSATTSPPVYTLNQNLVGQTALAKNADVSIVHTTPIDTLEVGVSDSNWYYYALNATDHTLGGHVRYTRKIRPDLSGSIMGYYWQTFKSPTYPAGHTWQINLTLDYLLNSKLGLTGGYIYRQQDTSSSATSAGNIVAENVVLVGIKYQVY